MSRHVMLAAAAGAMILGAGASAAKPVDTSVPQQIQRLLACRSVMDNAARLACFDKETQTVAGAFSTGDVVALDREKVRSTRRSLFGFHVPTLPSVLTNSMRSGIVGCHRDSTARGPDRAKSTR